MSQADFGALAGAAQSAVSQWENDVHLPTMAQVLQLRENAKSLVSEWHDSWLFEPPPAPVPIGVTAPRRGLRRRGEIPAIAR